MAILVSGGAGYIGSHTCVELLAAGYDIVVADNYYNSCPEALARVKKIAGKDFRFVEADMTDKDAVEKIFAENEDIDCVIQFAAYKAVGESVSKPIEYYSNNLACTLNILDVMRRHNCHNIIFSSSATVYGDPASVPIREDFPVGGTTNPYGTTKVFTERILTDCCHADPELNVALLRYFNPIGAHPSGLIGEDPNGIPNNLVPYIAKVAVGKLEKVHVFGNDYPTPDGTGVRDYIHVVDLARGHVAAIKKLEQKPGLFICNLGTGHGYSVLDVINAFSKACGKEIPYVIDPRRPGDIAECWCDPSKAKRELGWEAQYGIEEMCAHSWNWQSHNPDGYKTAESSCIKLRMPDAVTSRIGHLFCMPSPSGEGGRGPDRGRMRGGSATAARKRVAMARLPLISQRAGPLTASPKGEASLFYTYISWLRGGSLGTAGRGAAAVRQAAGERPTSRLKTRHR